MTTPIIAIKGFGKRVNLARKDLKSTQVALAQRALSPRASAKNIGRIEQEEVSPRSSTLQKIATATGVDVAWLATGKTPLRQNCVVRTAGIGPRISHFRIDRGLTMRALAEQAGLGESSRNVGRLESGEVRPRAGTLARLAKTLGVSVERLAYGA
jgi:transcriptional regulator with XRE-family HTH domain